VKKIFRRLAEKNVPDCVGFSFIFKAQKWAHSWLCKHFCNTEDGRKDKQAGTFFDRNRLNPTKQILFLIICLVFIAGCSGGGSSDGSSSSDDDIGVVDIEETNDTEITDETNEYDDSDNPTGFVRTPI